MNNFIRTIAFLLLLTTYIGQENPNKYNFGNYTHQEEKSSIDSKTADKIKSQKIAQEVLITTDKNGKSSFSSQISYNNRGQIIHFIKKHWKGSSDNVIEYTYNENNLLINRRFHNTQKKFKFEERKFAYNEKSLIKSFEVNGTKGIRRKTTFEYNGLETVKRDYFKKNQTTPFNSWTYSYYEDGSRKSTIFQKKGKHKYTWYYNCHPNGLLEKSKDTTRVCINTTSNLDGGYTWTKKETDEKNKIVITESTFTKDSVCQKYIQKFMDGTLKSTFVLNGKISTYTNFKNGKKYYTNIYELDGNENTISYKRIWHKNEKYNFTQTFHYDKKGLLVARENYNYEGKPTSKTKVIRTFY